MPANASPQLCEARFDPFTDRAVLIATKRRHRPTAPAICPGCHEEQTPPAVCVFPEGAPLDAPGWTVRVVPNKFSCFSLAGSNQRYEISAGLNGIKDPAGRCEVLFESPHHTHPIHARSPEEIVLCLRAMISRYQAARSDSQARFWYAFKNLGKAAGGTLDHPHWQLYTLPFVPPAIQDRYQRAAQYFNKTGRSLYRDHFSAEAASGDRVVAASSHFLKETRPTSPPCPRKSSSTLAESSVTPSRASAPSIPIWPSTSSSTPHPSSTPAPPGSAGTSPSSRVSPSTPASSWVSTSWSTIWLPKRRQRVCAPRPWDEFFAPRRAGLVLTWRSCPSRLGAGLTRQPCEGRHDPAPNTPDSALSRPVRRPQVKGVLACPCRKVPPLKSSAKR